MLSIHRTILLSEDAITAVDKLILLKRSEKPSFSKSFISKKLGIQSRGYLTDVLKGRKRINATYIKPLVSMLGLDECESRYLVSKWLLTSNFARSKISREELQRECENQAKNLRREEIEFSGKTDVDALFLVTSPYTFIQMDVAGDGIYTQR